MPVGGPVVRDPARVRREREIDLLAGQEAGLSVLGYCNQARFLLNCGLVTRLEAASVQQRALAARLIHEHEMGELFKVIGFCAGEAWEGVGFAEGDRTHTL